MIRVLSGDSRVRLAELADSSVDSCVCDPPYELGFMGKGWDKTGIANDPTLWAEVLRVLKPGGHLVAFSGTRTYHRMVCAIDDAGFEVRDSILDLIASDEPVRQFLESLSGSQVEAFFRCIEDSQFGGLLAWVYGSGFPKSLDVSKQIDKAAGAERERYQRPAFGGTFSDDEGTTYGTAISNEPATDAAREWQGWGTALKPSWEPICLARKPLIGTVAANVLAHGTGALNIDGCRIEAEPVIIKRSNNRGAQGGSAGWGAARENQSGDKFEQRESTIGRWPANLCHDGSEEVLAGFPEADARDGATKGTKNRGELWAKGWAEDGASAGRNDTGSAARFFYTAKATAEERADKCNICGFIGVGSGPRCECVGDDGKPDRLSHPTVKPQALLRWLVRLVTPKGGTVLDPFMGSGSTMIAADQEQFNAIGCELSQAYVDIAVQRIKAEAGMFAMVEVS